jgi:hypothetical protein
MPKLNPNEAPEGYVAVEGKGCRGCAFCAKHGLDISGYALTCKRKGSYTCGFSARKDGCSVIFHRKPTKPVRKPREWLAWAVAGDWKTWNIRDNIHLTRDQARDAQRGAACGGNLIRIKITEVM